MEEEGLEHAYMLIQEENGPSPERSVGKGA